MKKFLFLISTLIISVIVFNSSCSSVVKEPSTVIFTELDKEIQDTLFAIWQSGEEKLTFDTTFDIDTQDTMIIEIREPIDFIDLTNNYVLESKQDRLFHWIFNKVVVNKSNGWKHTFPATEPNPIIIKGDKIYTPTEYNFFLKTLKLDTCRFNVYTIKE